ncbi:hypothetical protein HDV01_003167 [Terramyces sp. JEL0728]|nr:hypothetical protein HDV01_003167 [Terramyces sp. JEL0728]
MFKLIKRLISISRNPIQNTFYRRELPNNLYSFTSPQGKELFRKSLGEGHAEIFFSLSGNFTMQSEPAFCGLGSLAMVLNALSVDPGKRWKGVWRWYADDMLECCASLEDIKKDGLNFIQLAATARGNGLNVETKRSDQTSYKEFINDLKKVTSSLDTHMVVSFSRKTLNQTGDGHFSPVGAYCPSSNQVLVMDTARFKYPSYFVDAKLLYEAMNPIDVTTGLPRGYFVLTRGDSKPLPLCKITAQKLEWQGLTKIFWQIIPQELKTNSNPIKAIVNNIPDKHHFYTALADGGFDLAGTVDGNRQLAADLKDEFELLMNQVKQHAMYNAVCEAMAPCESTCENKIHVQLGKNSVEQLATLFLLSLPRELLTNFPQASFQTVQNLRAESTFDSLPLLKEEISRMSAQWDTMLSSYCICGSSNCSKSL